MKVWLSKASNDTNEVREIETLNDLIKLRDEFKSPLIFSRNKDFQSTQPYPLNPKLWEEYKAKGLFECPFTIIVYDDYIE
ncbi:MAG: hypothetical protein WC325_10615 [Candidatus Bathyarchaeia archaeon]|jgi:hypothetical protein